MQHQPHEQSERDWRLKMKERATPVWRSLEKIPGSSLKHPASGGREKKKVQTFQFGNAAWMMSLPRRLRRCTCLINQAPGRTHVLPIYSSLSSAHGYTTPCRPSLRATSATCLPFSHMNFYRYAAMRVALGNRSGEHLKSRPQSRGSKLRSERKFVAGVL